MQLTTIIVEEGRYRDLQYPKGGNGLGQWPSHGLTVDLSSSMRDVVIINILFISAL